MNHRQRIRGHGQPLWLALVLGVAIVAGADPTKATAAGCLRSFSGQAQPTNEEGTTVLSFVIEADGSVSNIQVAKSSGFADLDDVAVSCASGWHYKPAMKDGVPVAVHWQTAVKWGPKN